MREDERGRERKREEERERKREEERGKERKREEYRGRERKPHINTSGNFSVHMSAESPSNISPDTSKAISKV
jgi:hypothetical protein